MTLRTRRILFLGFAAIFIPISVAVIFYSDGWRFDLETFSFKKTGAIYIETIPKDAQIYLDGKEIPNQAGLIKKGTLISDLLPKNYNLKIKKDGYFDYLKNIKVEESFVGELIDTILILKNLKSEEVFQNKSEKLAGDEIVDLENGEMIIKNSLKNVYYIYNLDEQTLAFNLSDSLNIYRGKKTEIKKVAIHPFDNNRFIIETFGGVYIFDQSRQKLEAIFQNSTSSQLLAWNMDNPTIYFVKSESISKNIPKKQIILSLNLITKIESQIFEAATTTQKISQIKISDSGSKIAFLDIQNNLFLLDSNLKEAKQIAGNVKNFYFSPNSKKIVFYDDKKISVYFFEDQYNNFKIKSGEIFKFNLKSNESVKNIFWYKDSYHLIIAYGLPKKISSVDFAEIDNREPQNIFNLIKDISDFFYYTSSNNFYFVDGGNFKFFKID
ncbi:PEGA domain-containing protein [Candidatus Wolfebacteria bacterium]|nr:PEGA domain-containing protein [Candidatus Wolfebacteria bacterium]